ncbi:MAG: hypothetical protein K0R57_6319 [Paenibacillaceae bacterium]|jgi:hypothetical protein|nr:hypothetical protein [Paenibacillaceae bacterium]
MNANTLTRREQILSCLSQQNGLLGIVAIWDANGFSVLTEGSDLLLVMVLEDGLAAPATSHYIQEGVRIQERRISRSSFETRAASHEDRGILHWMMQGDIWYDAEGMLARIRMDLENYPAIVKQQKMLTEFSLFTKRYLQCKDFLVEDQILDAYSSILRAIHHWARISVLEEGIHPEVTVWQQVRSYNAGVYKLYEELTTSQETLRQRVELVLLACEFSVMSKMETCCSLLVRILEETGQPLSVQELINHPYMSGASSSNLPLILNKLARKSIIREVAVATDADCFDLEIKYSCNLLSPQG